MNFPPFAFYYVPYPQLSLLLSQRQPPSSSHQQPASNDQPQTAEMARPQRQPRRKQREASEDDSDYEDEKRYYRPRREFTNRNYHCEIEGCERRYSSTIALNNHQRMKHNVRKRAIQNE